MLLSNVVAVAAGWDGSLLLKSDGTVAGLGRGVPKGLTNISAVAAATDYNGHNLALAKDGAVLEWDNCGNDAACVAGLSNVVAVAAGPDFGLALKSNGTVAAWSAHPSAATSVPAGLTNVIAIAAGGDSGPPSSTFALALKNDGTVTAWGQMDLRHPATIPVGLSNVVAVAAGDGWGLAITTNPAVADKFRKY